MLYNSIDELIKRKRKVWTAAISINSSYRTITGVSIYKVTEYYEDYGWHVKYSESYDVQDKKKSIESGQARLYGADLFVQETSLKRLIKEVEETKDEFKESEWRLHMKLEDALYFFKYWKMQYCDKERYVWEEVGKVTYELFKMCNKCQYAELSNYKHAYETIRSNEIRIPIKEHPDRIVKLSSIDACFFDKDANGYFCNVFVSGSKITVYNGVENRNGVDVYELLKIIFDK